MPHKFSPTQLFRNIIITDGGIIQINSDGNDKNIQIYHDDTAGIISTSNGPLYLQPQNNTIYGYNGVDTYAFALYAGAALGVMLHGGGNCYINNGNFFGLGRTDPNELFHMSSTLASKPVLKIENINIDANAPILSLTKTSTGSAADNDKIGIIEFNSLDENDAEFLYGRIYGVIEDASIFVTAGKLVFESGAGGSGNWFSLDQTSLKTNTPIYANNAAGPALLNEAATATNPTLIPNRAELDTGFGWAAADTITIITGGTEHVRIGSTGYFGIGVTADTLLHMAGSVPVLKIQRTTDTEIASLFLSPIAATSNAAPGWRLEMIGSASGNAFEIATVGTAGGVTPRLLIDSLGNIGFGVYAFGTDAQKVLGLSADGVVPTTSPAGMIQIFADDSSDGAANGTLALRTEQAVEATGVTTDARLQIWINGVEYYWGLEAV